MTTKKPALNTPRPFGTVRVRARAFLHGPADIALRQSSAEGFYGWPLLSLEAQEGRKDRIESRIVYGNLFNEEQATAVLRSVYWDGEAARAAYRQRERPFQLSLPARFVLISVRQAREWLSQFDDTSTVINDVIGEEDTIIIRRLRIERDYKSSVFEKVWQAQDKSHEALNQKWGQVWSCMTESLQNEPLISDADEDFWLARPWGRYDMKGWQPEQLGAASSNRLSR